MAEDSLVRDVGRTLGGYVTGQIKVSAILACLYAIGYAIAGVPFWLVLGAISGAVNVIPFVGSLIGLALTAYVVLLNDGTLWNYIGVLITFVVVQGLEGFWITPRILGRRVGLSPLYVFYCGSGWRRYVRADRRSVRSSRTCGAGRTLAPRG